MKVRSCEGLEGCRQQCCWCSASLHGPEWQWGLGRLKEAQPQPCSVQLVPAPHSRAQPELPPLPHATISPHTKLFTPKSKCNWLTPKSPLHFNWLVTFLKNKKSSNIILFSSQLVSFTWYQSPYLSHNCSWPRHSTNLLLLSLGAKDGGDTAQPPPRKLSQGHRLSRAKVCAPRTHAKHIHHFKAPSKTSDTPAQDFGKPLYLSSTSKTTTVNPNGLKCNIYGTF